MDTDRQTDGNVAYAREVKIRAELAFMEKISLHIRCYLVKFSTNAARPKTSTIIEINHLQGTINNA